jgi:hypothetical protein
VPDASATINLIHHKALQNINLGMVVAKEARAVWVQL